VALGQVVVVVVVPRPNTLVSHVIINHPMVRIHSPINQGIENATRAG